MVWIVESQVLPEESKIAMGDGAGEGLEMRR